MTLATVPFDGAWALDSAESQAELLADALATGDAAVITAALGIIARAKGMSDIARDAGLSREAIRKATGPGGNPTLATLLAIMRATGVQLSAKAA